MIHASMDSIKTATALTASPATIWMAFLDIVFSVRLSCRIVTFAVFQVHVQFVLKDTHKQVNASIALSVTILIAVFAHCVSMQ